MYFNSNSKFEYFTLISSGKNCPKGYYVTPRGSDGSRDYFGFQAGR